MPPFPPAPPPTSLFIFAAIGIVAVCALVALAVVRFPPGKLARAIPGGLAVGLGLLLLIAALQAILG